MPVDHIRYDLLAQDALRGVVRNVLLDAAKKGLPGEHHFFIAFHTRADGVRLSTRMREQYPEEMTVVLQHQFWDLKVNEHGFEVGLSFNGVAERLYVPFQAIKSFADPAVQFALQFGQIEGEPAAASPEPANAGKPDEKPAEHSSQAAREKGAAKQRQPKLEPGASVPIIPSRPSSVPAVAGPSTAEKSAPAAADSPPAGDKSDKPDKPKRGGQSGGQVVRLDRYRKK
jgi:uncharacterized protein